MRYRDELICHSVTERNPLIDNSMAKWISAFSLS